MRLIPGGTIKASNYIFLGDYVDRGYFGMEVLIYLFALKLLHPEKIVLLRGNHESRRMTEHFSFKRECEDKYSEQVYDSAMQVFDAMPLAAIFHFLDKRY